jgi:hypothetical protein
MIILVLLLFPILGTLNVPSFLLGFPQFWLLRWDNIPTEGMAIAFNPFTLLAVAAVIGLVGLVLSQRTNMPLLR